MGQMHYFAALLANFRSPSSTYLFPYSSSSAGSASPDSAAYSSASRTSSASPAVRPRADANTRALRLPRGQSGLRQYSRSLRTSTIAFSRFGSFAIVTE
jgi:hypothetical protein